MEIRNFGITDKLAKALFPNASSPLLIITKVREGLSKRGILTREVLVFTLATLLTENPLLDSSREQGSESYFREAYGNSLGPYSKGFPKWGGRGLPQLTGQENYELMARLLKEPKLLSNPDMLLEPAFGAEVLCEFINSPYYLNHLYEEARVRYNGGRNGMDTFKASVKLLERYLV